MAIKNNKKLTIWQSFVLDFIQKAGQEGTTTKEMREAYRAKFPERNDLTNIDKIVRALVKRDLVKRLVRGQGPKTGRVVAI